MLWYYQIRLSNKKRQYAKLIFKAIHKYADQPAADGFLFTFGVLLSRGSIAGGISGRNELC